MKIQNINRIGNHNKYQITAKLWRYNQNHCESTWTLHEEAIVIQSSGRYNSENDNQLQIISYKICNRFQWSIIGCNILRIHFQSLIISSLYTHQSIWINEKTDPDAEACVRRPLNGVFPASNSVEPKPPNRAE